MHVGGNTQKQLGDSLTKRIAASRIVTDDTAPKLVVSGTAPDPATFGPVPQSYLLQNLFGTVRSSRAGAIQAKQKRRQKSKVAKASRKRNRGR